MCLASGRPAIGACWINEWMNKQSSQRIRQSTRIRITEKWEEKTPFSNLENQSQSLKTTGPQCTRQTSKQKQVSDLRKREAYKISRRKVQAPSGRSATSRLASDASPATPTWKAGCCWSYLREDTVFWSLCGKQNILHYLSSLFISPYSFSLVWHKQLNTRWKKAQSGPFCVGKHSLLQSLTKTGQRLWASYKRISIKKSCEM